MYDDLLGVLIDLGILLAFLLLFVPWANAVVWDYCKEKKSRRAQISRALRNKIRVYDCRCGARCVRPLRGWPKPCDHCGGNLVGVAYQIEDHTLFIRSLLDRGDDNGDDEH